MRKGEIGFSQEPEILKTFVEEFNLLDPSTFGPDASKPTP